MTPRLIIDFKKDYFNSVKREVKNQFSKDEISFKNDQEWFLIYFNMLNRFIIPKPRKVFISDVFKCPEHQVDGWAQLKLAIELGKDINAYLSKYVSKKIKIYLFQDDLLNHWGIHHFHPSSEIQEDGFSKRGTFILFALVREDAFYAIKISDHNLVDQDLVEILHRNWPEKIADHKLCNDKLHVYSQDQIEQARKNNINIPISVSDGTTYMNLGGGVGASRDNFKAIQLFDKIMHYLSRLQKDIEENGLPNILPQLKAAGYQEKTELKCVLHYDDEKGWVALFPEYSLFLFRGNLEFLNKVPEMIKNSC